MGLLDSIAHTWDIWKNRNNTYSSISDSISSAPSNSGRFNSRYTDISIVDTIYNRIAVDVSTISFAHIKLDKETQDHVPQNSLLNNCLTVEANIDQSYMQFLQEVVITMCEEGVAAIVPITTTESPVNSNAYDIGSMRVGTIQQWSTKNVEVSIYNDETGSRESVTVPKNMVAIVENPFRMIMAKNNSVLKRLIRALSLSDLLDQMLTDNKFNLILQLPFALNHERKVDQAKTRIKDLEDQLASSKYGTAYIDSTEKITQLNRSLTSNIEERIEKLEQKMYNQFGLTKKIFEGEFTSEEYLNYSNRTLEPFVKAIVAEMNRKFLSKTARTQGQQIFFYNDVFKFIPVDKVAEMGDSLRRNAILTSNEVRGILGYRPSDDPRADLLENPNIADTNQNAENSMLAESGPEAASELSAVRSITKMRKDD